MMAVASKSIRAWQLASGVTLWLFAICAGAQQGNSLATWPRQVTTTITLGDGDSMARARTLAVERMRLEASAEVGALVATTAQLQDDRYSEQIRTLSVAFIKVTQVAESVSVNGQGRPALTVTAHVDVDEGAVAQVLSNWSRDEAKSREIVRLQEENARLQAVMKQPRPIQLEPERWQPSGMTLNQALRNRADLPKGVEINPDASAVSDQTKARIIALTATLDLLKQEQASLPSATASNGATMSQQWRLMSRIMDLHIDLDRAKELSRAESLRLSGWPGR